MFRTVLTSLLAVLVLCGSAFAAEKTLIAAANPTWPPMEFLDENKAVDVTSVFLSIFGIGRMVVTRFSLKQETASNRQTIEVRALSDEDYVIKSTEY